MKNPDAEEFEDLWRLVAELRLLSERVERAAKAARAALVREAASEGEKPDATQ